MLMIFYLLFIELIINSDITNVLNNFYSTVVLQFRRTLDRNGMGSKEEGGNGYGNNINNNNGNRKSSNSNKIRRKNLTFL